MSAESQPKKTPAPDPFSRQLDELDDLMQRMLAISVESATPAAPLPAFIPAGAPAPAEEPRPRAESAALAAFVPMVAPQTITPDNLDFQFAAPAIHSLRRPTRAAAANAAKPLAFIPLWLKPFALVDGWYDSVMACLGPVGRLLRGGLVRSLLGICGVVLLLASAIWMLWEGTDWNW